MGTRKLTARVLGDVLAVGPRGVAGVQVAHVAGRGLPLWFAAGRAARRAGWGLGADVAGGVAADLGDVAVVGELAALARRLRRQGLGGDGAGALSHHGGILAEGDLWRIPYQLQRLIDSDPIESLRSLPWCLRLLPYLSTW